MAIKISEGDPSYLIQLQQGAGSKARVRPPEAPGTGASHVDYKSGAQSVITQNKNGLVRTGKGDFQSKNPPPKPLMVSYELKSDGIGINRPPTNGSLVDKKV